MCCSCLCLLLSLEDGPDMKEKNIFLCSEIMGYHYTTHSLFSLCLCLLNHARIKSFLPEDAVEENIHFDYCSKTFVNTQE